MSVLPKAIYTFKAIPIKIPIMYFSELEQIFQKFLWNYKRPHIATVTLRKKNKLIRIILPIIKMYCEVIEIKTVWYCHKNRHID